MSATNVARAGNQGNICVGNNVSSFARVLNILLNLGITILESGRVGALARFFRGGEGGGGEGRGATFGINYRPQFFLWYFRGVIKFGFFFLSEVYGS